MAISAHIKEASRVVGYFAYTNPGEAFCDGDACIIAGSEELMKSYLRKIPDRGSVRWIIKKTRFGEIINGMRQGGAYAFDKKSYDKFLYFAKLNEIDGLPGIDWFLDKTEMELNFIRIQLTGL